MTPEPRPPVPPFDEESARKKVKAAQVAPGGDRLGRVAGVVLAGW